MTRSYRTCAQTLKPALSLGAALFIIVSTSTWAQPVKDVKKWLKEFKGQLKQPDTSVNFSGADSTRFSLPQNTVVIDIDETQLAPVRNSINDENFEIKYKKVVRANRERLRRMLKKAVEINLVNIKEPKRRHRFYINTVEQYIASNNRIGQLSYTLQVSAEESTFDIRYAFR